MREGGRGGISPYQSTFASGAHGTDKVCLRETISLADTLSRYVVRRFTTTMLDDLS